MRRIGTALALLVVACEGGETPVPDVVDAPWLRAHREAVVLVDLQSKPELYAKGHIAGAVYANLEDFRDGKKDLAPVEKLERRLGELGIGPDTHVVAYDELYGRNAGWLWYVLAQLGHERVSLLDGGMDAFREELVAGPPPAPAAVTYRARKQPSGVVDSAFVASRPAGVVLIDTRPREQYTGEKPKDGMKPGHIPGAISLPWEAFRGKDNRFLAPEEAAKLVANVPKDAEVVLYCNSYHMAAHVHFQLHRLGYANVKAFDGSVEEWTKDPARPLKTGVEP